MAGLQSWFGIPASQGAWLEFWIICFWSNFLWICTPGSSRWWFKKFDSCYPREKPGWNSMVLASACPSSYCCGPLGSESVKGRCHCHSISLFLKQSENKHIYNGKRNKACWSSITELTYINIFHRLQQDSPNTAFMDVPRVIFSSFALFSMFFHSENLFILFLKKMLTLVDIYMGTVQYFSVYIWYILLQSG